MGSILQGIQGFNSFIANNILDYVQNGETVLSPINWQYVISLDYSNSLV